MCAKIDDGPNKPWSDICGIATKSWPASEFITSSARRSRPVGAPGLYAYTRISFRPMHEQLSPRCRPPSLFAERSALCYRSARRTPAPQSASPAGLSVSHTRRDTMTINVGDRIPSVTLSN